LAVDALDVGELLRSTVDLHVGRTASMSARHFVVWFRASTALVLKSNDWPLGPLIDHQ